MYDNFILIRRGCVSRLWIQPGTSSVPTFSTPIASTLNIKAIVCKIFLFPSSIRTVLTASQPRDYDSHLRLIYGLEALMKVVDEIRERRLAQMERKPRLIRLSGTRNLPFL